MSLLTERNEVNATTPSLINWLMNLVLKLPSDNVSSLKIDPISLIGFTDVRHGTYGNQDRIAVAYSIEQSPASSWMLAVVCDGVGGSLHGERAAAMTIASMCLELAVIGKRQGSVEILRELLQQAHLRTSNAFHSKSSTTAVALLVMGETAAIGWIGDSRAYQISAGKASLLTSDDTLAGAISRADLEVKFELNDEYADRLSQAIGAESPVTSNAIAWEPLTENTFCILCTDGIWKPTESAFDAVVDTCRDGPELMRRLLRISDWMGGIDNASAILVPPLEAVREFIADPTNATPRHAIMVCLPGNLQALIPINDVKEPNKFTLSSPQNPDPDKLVGSKPKVQKTTKRKSPNSPKGRSKNGPNSANQLIIEEETLDDASTETAGKIRSDGTPP